MQEEIGQLDECFQLEEGLKAECEGEQYFRANEYFELLKICANHCHKCRYVECSLSDVIMREYERAIENGDIEEED